MKKLGIVIGNGILPLLVIKECKKRNIEPFCALVQDFANSDDYKEYNNITLPIGHVGEALDYFSKNEVKDIIFVGGVKKPSLKSLKVDEKGFTLLKKLLKEKIFGDNSTLEIVINFFEKEGFNIIQVDNFLSDIKIKEGFAGSIKFDDNEYLKDKDIAIELLNTLSNFDVGQGVVIQESTILAIEGAEGTEQLIKRCKELKYEAGRKPILVKIKKKGQTKKADLPTIAPDTIKQLKESGFAGIFMDCKNGLVLDKEKVIEEANKEGIFVYGIKVKN